MDLCRVATAYRCVPVMTVFKERCNGRREEEQLYLMLHINRMKEDCNLKYFFRALVRSYFFQEDREEGGMWLSEMNICRSA